MNTQQIEQWSQNIIRNIRSAVDFGSQVSRIMFYYPIKKEANLLPLLHLLYDSGKEVYLPKIIGTDIIPARFSGEQELREGKYSIPEPPRSEIPPSIDIAFIPLVAFSEHCARLGRGKGYYDRFLKSFEIEKKVGIAFEIQKLKDIPMFNEDVYLDMVVTEERIYEC